MSKYKIIAFLLAVVGLVLILVGVNSDSSSGNVAKKNNNGGTTSTEPVIVEPIIVDPQTEPEPSVQLTDQTIGYWYESEKEAGSYVHITSSNIGSQLEFDWVLMEANESGELATKMEVLAQVADFSAEDSLYHFNYNDVYYTVTFDDSNIVVINDGTTDYTYANYQESAR